MCVCEKFVHHTFCPAYFIIIVCVHMEIDLVCSTFSMVLNVWSAKIQVMTALHCFVLPGNNTKHQLNSEAVLLVTNLKKLQKKKHNAIVPKIYRGKSKRLKLQNLFLTLYSELN